MSKNCIVSLATKNGVYVDRLARLSNSLRDNFSDGDFIGFIHESSVGAEPHLQNPYSFKIHAINKCREAGYTKIVWADTSLFAVKSVEPIFEEISKYGYFFHDSLHLLSDWCNGNTLSYFGIKREDLQDFTMVHGGLIGFDFDNKISVDIFSELEQAMKDGCFKGDWSNHRHEMATISCIIYKSIIEFTVTPPDEILQFAGIFDQINNTEIIFKAQG